MVLCMDGCGAAVQMSSSGLLRGEGITDPPAPYDVLDSLLVVFSDGSVRVLFLPVPLSEDGASINRSTSGRL